MRERLQRVACCDVLLSESFCCHRELDAERNQVLLRAVVDIALDLPALALLGCDAERPCFIQFLER